MWICRRLRQLSASVFIVALSSVAWAHRAPPPRVEPVVAGGVKLVSRYRITSRSCVALVEALPASAQTPPADTVDDARDHAFLWRAEIFRVRVTAPLEQDAQWVFVKSMQLRGNELVLVNERGARFALDLSSHRVRREP